MYRMDRSVRLGKRIDAENSSFLRVFIIHKRTKIARRRELVCVRESDPESLAYILVVSIF